MSSDIVNCFGISQDPKTKNFMMVMEYIKNGSMSQYLKSNYNELRLDSKLYLFHNVSYSWNLYFKINETT